MKAVFYWSQKMHDYRVSTGTAHFTSIDGKQFNDQRTIEDDEPIQPFNSWGDNVLIAVVENVKTDKDGFARDEELEKRIKYK